MKQLVDRLVDFDHATGGHHAVERAERVSDRTAADRHHIVDRVVIDVETGVVNDPAHMGRHFLGAEQTELEYLAAAPNRLDDLVRLGRGEHPDHMAGGFLKGLQQGVLRSPGQHVNLVEDVDLHPPRVAEVDFAQQITHVFDAVIARGVEFVQIEGAPLFDGRAAFTGAARLRVLAEILAVERFGQHPRRTGLAGAPRAAEHVCVADLVIRHSVAQGCNNVVLTSDLGEFLRSVATVEGLIGHVRAILLRVRDTAVVRNLRSICGACTAPVSGSDGQVVCGTRAAPLRAAAFRP